MNAPNRAQPIATGGNAMEAQRMTKLVEAMEEALLRDLQTLLTASGVSTNRNVVACLRIEDLRAMLRAGARNAAVIAAEVLR